MYQIRALTKIDIAERRVTVIARPVEHNIPAIDLAREEYTVTVIRQQGIFEKNELFEIEGVSNPNGRTEITITPGYIIAVFQPDNAWIIAILELTDFGIIAAPFDRLMLQLPVDTIITEAAVQVHVPLFIVTAKDTRELPIKGNDRAVENAI